MATIKTWQQRCEEHPDGIVTNPTTRNFMQEEIDELRAALDALEKQEPTYWVAREKTGTHPMLSFELSAVDAAAVVARWANDDCVEGEVVGLYTNLLPHDQMAAEYERGRKAGITAVYDAMVTAQGKGVAAVAEVLDSETGWPHTATVQWLLNPMLNGSLLFEFAPAQPLRELSEEQIAAIVREHLTAVYHCTRVWEAWGVGTMGEDDFEPADESDMPEEIARAVLAAAGSAK